MKQLLISILMIQQSVASKVGDFCKLHLIAVDPIDVIVRLKLKPDPTHEAWMINMYRMYGAKAYYGDKKAARHLKFLGEEMRAYGVGEEALKDYSRFER